MKKYKWFLVTGALFIMLTIGIFACLSACTPPEEETQNHNFWILVDADSYEYGAQRHITDVIRSARKAYPDLLIDIEFLPNAAKNPKERKDRIEKIRTEIMAGNGPDVYLMCNDTIWEDRLFKDVQQAMHNGLFADISAYYNQDTDLGKEQLNKTVMDAGVVGDARYVLPLYYNTEVLYADKERMNAAGLDLENAATDFPGLLNELQSAGNSAWYINAFGSSATFSYASLLPELIDYETGNVQITEAQMADFLRTYGLWKAKDPGKLYTTISPFSYVNSGAYFNETLPAISYDLKNALGLIALSKLTERELVAIPVRGMDGAVTACVSFYAAVGAGCKQIDIAYHFVRAFLTEESQYQQELLSLNVAHVNLMTGLPVRSVGTTEALWKMYKKQLSISSNGKDTLSRKKAVLAIELTEGDVPVLDTPIDRVHFATNYDRTVLVAGLQKIVNGENIDTVAKDMLYQLKLHAAEG